MRLAGVFFAFLVCAQALFAQVDVTAYADRTQAVVGEQIVITLRIVASKNPGRIATPEVPANDFFSVLRADQNQSSSSSIQIINGRMNQTTEITTSITYVIAAKKEGTATFPGLTLSIDGKEYATQPFAISIGKETSQSADVSVRILADKTALFAGEQTGLTIQVVKKENSPSQLTQEGFTAMMGQVTKAASAGLSLTPLFKQVTGVQEQVGGQLCRVYRARYAAVAIQAGEVSIPAIPMEYVMVKRVQNRRSGDPFFDDFFGGDPFFGGGVQQVGKSVMSNALTLRIKPLPPAPAGFAGAVGKCTFTATADPLTVPAGEAVTFTLTLKGAMRPNNLGEPILPVLNGIETFSPEKSIYTDTTDAGILSRKVIKYLLIPQQEGTIVIPELKHTYFDPASGTYTTATAGPITLTVTKGKAGAARQTASRYVSQNEIRQVGSDIRYIKIPKRIVMQSDRPYQNVLFLVLYALPFLVIGGAGVQKIQSKMPRNHDKALRSKALRMLLVSTAALKKELAANAKIDIVGKLSQSVEDFLSHKFSIAAQGKTTDELRDILISCTVSAETAEAIVVYLQELDRMRFGGVSSAASTTMIDKLESLARTVALQAKKEVRA